MAGSALKYKHSFPILKGLIIKKVSKGIFIDLGSDKRIKREMNFIIYREGDEIRHPVTGKVLGSEPIELGEAKIKDVFDEFSRAVIKKGKSENIRIKNQVIAK